MSNRQEFMRVLYLNVTKPKTDSFWHLFIGLWVYHDRERFRILISRFERRIVKKASAGLV